MTTEQQIRLLQEQNALLREQNELLQKIVSTLNYDGREIYVDNIEHDEMRSGFLVTSHKKKLWNVQIGLIKEFDRICKKHNLRWFAIGGTLIGAARHGGYVPWDDDVDIVMLRPDYEKFRKIAASEINPPYYLDIWYDYRLESDEPSKLTDNSLPLVLSEYHKKRPLGVPFFPLIRIRDKRTLFLEHIDDSSFNASDFLQYVFIDILPLDPLPPFAEEKGQLNFNTARVLFIAAVQPEMIKDNLQKIPHSVVDTDTLLKFMKLPYKQRCMMVEDFLAEKFFMSKHIGDLRDWCLRQEQRSYQSKDFRDIVYLPFEKIEVPAPIGYESVLTDFYGDWRTPRLTHIHSDFYSAEISFDEYAQKTFFR